MSLLNLVGFQIPLFWENPEKNLEKIETSLFNPLVKRFKGCPSGIRTLAVFPEMALTGFTLQGDKFILTPNHSNKISDLAIKSGFHLVVPVLQSGMGGRFRNTLLVFEPEKGSIIFEYQKVHPFSFAGEDRHFIPGIPSGGFNLSGFHIFCAICYDLRFPELFRQKEALGAELIIIPASWPEKRVAHWRQLLIARAIENQAFVLGLNRVGEDPNLKYNGNSLLIGPRGELLSDPGDGEDLLISTLHLEEVHSYRREFPLLKDMKFQIIQK